MIERFGRALPFSREQTFDIAADIERYPDFLKGWISARITHRHANIIQVDQEVGFGPVHLRFAATAVMQRPERLDVTSTDESFNHFSLSWIIASTPPDGCRLSISASIELKSVFLQYAVAPFLPSAIDEIILAFEARAHALCSEAGH
jgi:coenzyme Q-binding protein COQ10